MNRLGKGWRFLLTISTTLLIAALVLPAATLGASAKITFGHEYDGLPLGGNCVDGRGPNSANLHFVWKSSSGAPKANVTLTTSDFGSWYFCSEDGDTLAVGDQLKATVGAYTRRFVIPLITVDIDRVHGLFRGRAPAGTSFVLWLITRGCCADFAEDVDLTADTTGRWMYDNDGYDVNGYDAHMEWHSAKGDVVSAYGSAPEATVRINRPIVAGYGGHPRSAWKLALWDPATGLRKGVASGVTDEYGSFGGEFLDAAGDPVNVLPGDKIIGTSLATDLKFITRDIQASADVANDFVTGQCGNTGGHSRVDVFRGSRWIGGTVFLDYTENGNFTVDFSGEETIGYTPANIRHGDWLLVTCGTPNGDFVAKGILVP